VRTAGQRTPGGAASETTHLGLGAMTRRKKHRAAGGFVLLSRQVTRSAAFPDAVDLQAMVYVDTFRVDQPYRLAFFGEKTSLEEILQPISRGCSADLYLPAGEISDPMLYTCSVVWLDMQSHRSSTPPSRTGAPRQPRNGRGVQEAVDEQTDQEHLDSIAERANKALETVREQIKPLEEQIRIDPGDYELPERPRLPKPEITVEADGSPLIDSAWPWSEQSRRLIASKAYEGECTP
jgi:hypothetical protein